MRSGGSRVLITGVDGFTGRYLESLLEKKDYKVFGTTHNTPHKSNHFLCDLMDTTSLLRIVKDVEPEYVCHLAAVSNVASADKIAIYQTNIFGTQSLLEALTNSSVCLSKVVLASTGNIYGGDKNFSTENSCVDPKNHYAISKLGMERVATDFYDALPIVISRPFNYTGTGQSSNFLAPKIINSFKNGDESLELGNLDVSRDFSDVRDVVAAYCTLLNYGVPGEVYNICSQSLISLNDLIDYAAAIHGKVAPKVLVNKNFQRSNEIAVLWGSNQKLSALGWRPQYCIEDTIRWMLSS